MQPTADRDTLWELIFQHLPVSDEIPAKYAGNHGHCERLDVHLDLILPLDQRYRILIDYCYDRLVCMQPADGRTDPKSRSNTVYIHGQKKHRI